MAGYVYGRVAGQPLPEPAVPGQLGVAGRFLTPYSRDFFAVFAR